MYFNALDRIFVRSLSNEEQKIVTIEGEVSYPQYAVESQNERITDLIERAGGLNRKLHSTELSF
jgi:protein involved in polysaccharide export with SLBB domain